MGLLDEKSESNIRFYVGKNRITQMYFLSDNNELMNCISIYESTPNKLNLSYRKIYTLNDLINKDLSNISGIDAKHLRNYLFKLGLLNEYDRKYLLSIGFKEEDLILN